MLTSREVATLLKVHPKHVYRLMKRGLPAHRVGDEWRFLEAEVLRWTGASPGDASGDNAEGGFHRPPLVAANGDVAIELLLAETRQRGAPIGLVEDDHTGALELLRGGAVVAAGCHGEDAATISGVAKAVRLHLTNREVGLVARKGLRLRRATAVIGRRLASRPTTAGVRRHLDEALRKEGADSAAVHATATLHASHRDVVCAVVRGEADVGLASRAWACRAGLAFSPLAYEAYGLVLSADSLGDARVVALCEAAQGGAYRRRLTRELGYDTRSTGELRYAGADTSGR